MIDFENDEQILDQFRTWLRETRQEATLTDDGGNHHAAPPAPGFGLDRLVEEFTALRHELKLQTRSARGLEERLEASLTSLAEAASTFRSAATSETAAASSKAGKHFAMTLAELDEALERGREQWEKNSARLIGPPASPALAQVNDDYARQSWWQRRLTAAHHRRACQRIEQAEDQSRRERQAVLTALLSGQGLIQQRLARAMVDAGVMRIPTVGRLVDPEQMIVVEVVDAAGPAGQVVQEVRRGYTWQGGLLRPAEVRAIRPRFDLEDEA